MMNINLEKELEEASTAVYSGVQQFADVEEVKLLLAHNDVRERKVLDNFNLSDSLARVEKETGKLMEVEDFKACYGNAYALAAIRQLAIKYRMRFLPLSKFKGAIDPLLATRILEFGEKHGIDVTSSGEADNFYVLAPGEDFHLDLKVHEQIKYNYIRPVVSLDPLLFYRGMTKDNNNRGGNLWTLVHKWGTEFNYLRLLRAIPFRNATCLWVSNALAYSGIALLLMTIIPATFAWNPFALVLASALVGCLFSFIRSANISSTEEKNLFSEHNWSDTHFHVDTTRTVDIQL